MDYNWLNPKAEARPVGEKGWGSFATEPIAAGEVVAAFGGWVVNREYLSTVSHDRQARSIQIADDLYLVSSDEREPGDMLNHSCDPNCGLLGSQVLVAMRDIAPGEEITFDYNTFEYEIDQGGGQCTCGAATCRGRVPGFKHVAADVRARYGEYIAEYLRTIENGATVPAGA